MRDRPARFLHKRKIYHHIIIYSSLPLHSLFLVLSLVFFFFTCHLYRFFQLVCGLLWAATSEKRWSIVFCSAQKNREENAFVFA